MRVSSISIPRPGSSGAQAFFDSNDPEALRSWLAPPVSADKFAGGVISPGRRAAGSCFRYPIAALRDLGDDRLRYELPHRASPSFIYQSLCLARTMFTVAENDR